MYKVLKNAKESIYVVSLKQITCIQVMLELLCKKTKI